jgi:hypothetical protein
VHHGANALADGDGITLLNRPRNLTHFGCRRARGLGQAMPRLEPIAAENIALVNEHQRGSLGFDRGSNRVAAPVKKKLHNGPPTQIHFLCWCSTECELLS